MPPSPPRLTPGLRRSAGMAALLTALAIAWLSLIPAEGVPAPQVSDKIRHFVAYAALALPFTVWMGVRRWLAAAVIAAVYGAAMEVAQALAPTGREGSFGDAAANAGGALIGALAARLIWRGQD
ncbi:VanZ family protein [Hyphomonas sp.]|uniref:VanZ family protein n=1 Tax=Hyphomonas sp. TaxID=87 RepID=UPI00391DD70E